ncbi:MAG: hypothetical protein IT209_07520 [Armatimonadetes bacterium]|nr:hypothetical protein [Armatimonadota bacterium]
MSTPLIAHAAVAESSPRDSEPIRLAPATVISPTGVAVGTGYLKSSPSLAFVTPDPAPPPAPAPSVLAATGAILHIEPGANWCNFIDACQKGVAYTVKNVVLTKTTPSLIQCSDVFAARTIHQQGTANIRTWWPLMYEAPGTTFELTILYGTPVAVQLKGDSAPAYVHREVWTWEVVSSIVDLRTLLIAFHTLPFGTDEVPLISDENLYTHLLALLDVAETARQNSDMVTASLALGDFEMAIADACLAASPQHPAPAGPGTGIAQTRENPACCALAVNAEYILSKGGIGQPAQN